VRFRAGDVLGLGESGLKIVRVERDSRGGPLLGRLHLPRIEVPFELLESDPFPAFRRSLTTRSRGPRGTC
jgi:hypothetical protein